MTEIRENSFGLHLPGQWERVESSEPSTFVYRETEHNDTVTVTLLGVRPMFGIADPKRLLDDYLHHRSRFEQGRDPALQQSEPATQQLGESLEGGWDAVETVSGRRVRHRVVLIKGLLADFRYETTRFDEAAFAKAASDLLGSATVSVE